MVTGGCTHRDRQNQKKRERGRSSGRKEFGIPSRKKILKKRSRLGSKRKKKKAERPRDEKTSAKSPHIYLKLKNESMTSGSRGGQQSKDKNESATCSGQRKSRLVVEE